MLLLCCPCRHLASDQRLRAAKTTSLGSQQVCHACQNARDGTVPCVMECLCHGSKSPVGQQKSSRPPTNPCIYMVAAATELLLLTAPLFCPMLANTPYCVFLTRCAVPCCGVVATLHCHTLQARPANEQRRAMHSTLRMSWGWGSEEATHPSVHLIATVASEFRRTILAACRTAHSTACMLVWQFGSLKLLVRDLIFEPQWLLLRWPCQAG